MIRALLRVDPAIRVFPYLLIPVVLSSAMLGWSAAGGWTGVSLLGVVVFQCVMLATLTATLPGTVSQRCSEMQLALPIDGRSWIALRVGVNLLVGWVALGLGVLAFVSTAGLSAVRAPQGLVVAATAAAWAAWVLACFAWRPERSRIDSTAGFAGLKVFGLALVVAAFVQPVLCLVASLALVAFAGIRLWRDVPRALVLAARRPMETTLERESDEELDVRKDQDVSRSLRSWLAGSTFFRPSHTALLVASFFIAIVATEADEPGGLASLLIWFVPIFAAIAILDASRVLSETAHLPIPRTRIAPFVLLPGFVAVVGGVVLGSVLRPIFGGSALNEQVDLVVTERKVDGSPGAQRVQVPGSLARFTLRGNAREIRAPWGEVAHVEPKRVVPGLPLRVVNPYGIDANSSVDFKAWQLARALHAAHGVDVDHQSLRDGYPRLMQGRAKRPSFGEAFARNHPELGRPASPGSMTLASLVGVFLWLAGGLWSTRPVVSHAERAGWKRQKAFTFGLFALALVAACVLALVSFAPDPSVPSVRLVAGATLVDLAGGQSWPGALLTAAIAVGGYVWLVRRFERVEVRRPIPKPRLPR